MPVQVSYPGVYIQEVPSGVRTITGVSTSIALVIGMTQRGPMDAAVNLLSFADYERSFGSDTTVSETTDQVRQFFLNGGRQAYVIRIAANEQAAVADLRNEAGAIVLRITAAEAGRIGESIRVEVNYATAQPEATFNLVVSREIIDATGTPVLVETETIGDLSMNPVAARYVDTTVEQESRLIRAAVQPTAPAAFAGYSMSGRAVADPLATLNAELAAQGNVGRLQISVDQGPFTPVLLTGPLAALGDVQTAINTALSVIGGSVTVLSVAIPGGAEEVLLVRSAAAGGRVRIQPGASNDVAGPMHLGTANDGLEVDGHAARRPAPTGLFASLGDLDSTLGTWLNRFANFLRADPADLPDLVLTTSQRVDTIAVSGFTRPAFWENVPPAGTTLRNARGALDLLSQLVTNTPNVNWLSSVRGFRLVLNPTFASLSEQESVVVSTTGAFDIANAATGYLGRVANVRRAPLGSFATPSNYVAGVAAGLDGDKPQLQDYRDAYGTAARDIDVFNLLLLPRVLSDGSGSSQSDAERALLWGPASAFCRDERAFLVIDPPEAWGSAEDARTNIANLRIGVVGDHAMVAFPRLRIPDPASGQLRSVDPAGSIAGVAARIDGSRGVWKAPAGLEATILGVRGVTRRLSDPENGQLNPQAVNVIRQFPNGIVIWGSRTLAGFDNSGEEDYKYVPVRRFALFLEESLYRGLQWAVFEPNDEPLWAQIRLAAGAFMNNLFRRGAFQGQKASEAYFVKCDSETTTQNDINLGIVNVVVGFAPLKPAEFVVITIRQLAGQVQT